MSTFGRLFAVAAFSLMAGAAFAAAPGNDKIQNAFSIPDSQTSLFGTLAEATADTAGPWIMGSPNRPSVWYRIDAPRAGSYYVDTAGTFMGRTKPGQLYVAVFKGTKTAPSSLLKQGGAIKVNGSIDEKLTGFRIDVPAGVARLWIAVASVDADGRKAFRLNLQRLNSRNGDPVVITPPESYRVAGGMGNWPGHFSEQPIYAVYNSPGLAQPKAKITFSHDFPDKVSFSTPASTIVGHNEAIAMKPVAVQGGPYMGQVGSFDHRLAAVAREPATLAPIARRYSDVKWIRSSPEESIGEIVLRSTSSSLVGTMGEIVSADVQVKNNLSEDAIGCSFLDSPYKLLASGGPYAGQRFSYVRIDPDTKLPFGKPNPSFDLAEGETRHFRVSTEVRKPGNGLLMPTLACANPTSASRPPIGLHHTLSAENAPLLLFHGSDFADPEISFVFDGSQAEGYPRRYVVPVSGTKRFPVIVKNTEVFSLSYMISANGILPGFGNNGIPIDATLCVDSAAPEDACSADPVALLPLTLAAGASAKLLVTLHGKGESVPLAPASNRLFLKLSIPAKPGVIGVAGFGVSTSP